MSSSTFALAGAMPAMSVLGSMLEYADEIEEECEEEYEEWDEYCEIGGYDSWNGCDQYQHQEEGQWQEWEHKGHSPDESEEHGETE